MAEEGAAPVLTDEALERAFEELRSVRRRKRADYARAYADDGSGLGNLRRGGWEGVVIRLQDKTDRLNGFALQSVVEGRAEAANEPVRDAFVDAALYSLLGLVCYDAGVSWRKDLSARRALPRPDDAA